MNIYPTIHDDETVKIIDELSGQTLVNLGPQSPDTEVSMNKKVEELQAISSILQVAVQHLKVSPGKNQEETVIMLAGIMYKLHNTEFASFVRNIRASLELFDKWAGDHREDLRNKAALEWIRKGKEVNPIPFI